MTDIDFTTPVSIILTIYNKQNLIKDVIDGIVKNTSQYVDELIIVIDGCTDDSEKIVKNYLNSTNKKIKIKYIYTDNVHETRANFAGIEHVVNPFFILIQDDMVIKELFFDRRFFSI